MCKLAPATVPAFFVLPCVAKSASEVRPSCISGEGRHPSPCMHDVRVIAGSRSRERLLCICGIAWGTDGREGNHVRHQLLGESYGGRHGWAPACAIVKSAVANCDAFRTIWPMKGEGPWLRTMIERQRTVQAVEVCHDYIWVCTCIKQGSEP